MFPQHATFRLDSVFRSYHGTPAVNGISLHAQGPALIALLGPNGAGKTTTLRMLTGALVPTSGSVSVAGIQDPSGNPRARRHVGFLSEFAAAYPEMTPRQFLRYRAALWNMPRNDGCKRCADAIRRCDLDAVQDRPIAALSKGFRQRVGLAAAILTEPDILILDEPTSGLDPSQILAFRALITDLAADRLVVLSSHVLAEIEAVATRTVVMAHGRVVFDGTLNLETSPITGYVIECRAGADVDANTDLSRLAGRLLAMDGVASVRGEPAASGWHRLDVTGDGDPADLGERLAAALAGAGRLVRLLAPRRETLERRFHTLVQPRAPGDAA